MFNEAHCFTFNPCNDTEKKDRQDHNNQNKENDEQGNTLHQHEASKDHHNTNQYTYHTDHKHCHHKTQLSFAQVAVDHLVRLLNENIQSYESL